jgi:acyl-CoA reductase-like NAD-dependent aldehyde dehydrogenase
VQVSEHSSWSIGFYSRIVEAALAAAGAPAGLVRFVTGYGDAGHALVTGGVDKVITVWARDLVIMQSSSSSCSSSDIGGEFGTAAAGAPAGLVHFVTGYGDAGHALVTGGVDKVNARGCKRMLSHIVLMLIA